MAEKTALIVGASRGLGLGLAGELFRRGWRVIATARGPAPELEGLAKTTGGAVRLEEVDLASPQSQQGLLERLAGERLDLVFVNAGVMGPKDQSLAALTPEQVGEVMWTNAFAPVRLAQLLLAQVPEGGQVAFMTSQLGSIADNASGGWDLYRASKAAQNMLVASFFARDVAGRAVAVLSLHPGWVATDMGGPNAPLSVAESARGMVDVLERETAPGHRFLNYRGEPLGW